MKPIELLFPVALLLYTCAIWGSRRSQEMRFWTVVVMGLGLAADLSGTIFLCVAASSRWTWSWHTISGGASVVIMFAHFCCALIATRFASWARWFHRWSRWAWGFWLFSLATGIALGH